MVYEKYGATFKKMRKHKGVVLEDFLSIGVGRTALSDFERGKSMLSLDKLDSALQFMGFSLSEYDMYLNKYMQTDILYLMLETEEALIVKDIQKLEKILKISQDIQEEKFSLAIELILGKGDTHLIIDNLVDFLYEAKIFNRREILIFYIIMPYIPPKDILNILKYWKRQESDMMTDIYHQRAVFITISQAAMVLMSYNLKEESKYYIQFVKSLRQKYSMFLNNLINGVLGVWIYKFENKDKGIEMINQFLSLFILTGGDDKAKYYLKRIEEVIGDKIPEIRL
ncbi:Rgg/GadR/MutR family transcriptional regulator [Lactococcus garvieae]|uniref:Rgg/GadR/MutR family transcriptional regulator n=1 Tax=Lactococcus garvieae TaxID=1363 RepID=UPI00254E6A6E|nr:Rgg/GadR/MutR family transcriptional regulator [Lactococcus garvieae]